MLYRFVLYDSHLLGSTYGKVLCALSLFIGLFIAFAGHRYFQIEMLFVGFATFSTVSYIILVNRFETDVTGKSDMKCSLNEQVPSLERNVQVWLLGHQ